MQRTRSLVFGAALLLALGVLFGTPALAQEPPPEPEPQPAEAQPAQQEAPPAETQPAQPAATAPQTAPAEPEPQQAVAPRIFQPSWEVVVDGKAEANGTLELVFEPRGGVAKLLKVNVVAKTKKDDIAEDLGQEIAFAAGSAYKVKVSGNTVKVKVANKKMAPCYLGIETQAVNGVSVRVGKG